MARWHRDEAESSWLRHAQQRTPSVTTRKRRRGERVVQPC